MRAQRRDLLASSAARSNRITDPLQQSRQTSPLRSDRLSSVVRMSGLIGERRHAEAGFIALNPSA